MDFPSTLAGPSRSQAKFQLMKHKSHFIIGACIAALAFSAPLDAQTMRRKSDSPSPSPSASASPAASPSKPSARSNPFHGMVSAADQNAKTDRKSTRLNSSHANISYAVFCLKKKKKTNRQ